VVFSRSHVTLSHITSPTGNLNVAWRDTPPSAWRNLRNVWHMNEKHSNIVEKANIETFVIAEVNRSQSALYNQKLSGFNFNCVPGCHHILFVGSISPWQSQINPETLRRLVANISISSSFIKFQVLFCPDVKLLNYCRKTLSFLTHTIWSVCIWTKDVQLIICNQWCLMINCFFVLNTCLTQSKVCLSH